MLSKVLVVVSNVKTGDTYLCRSYPDDDINNNGKIELYRTPVYKVIIKGLDSTNSMLSKEWPAVRFMPYWNDPNALDSHYKTKGWVNSGLHKLERRKVALYKPDYGTQNRHSPFSGAIQLKDSFLIHAGPQTLNESGWGSAGCVEIIGNFDSFKEDIKRISGSPQAKAHDAILELVKAGKLYVEVEYDLPPNFKLALEREEA